MSSVVDYADIGIIGFDVWLHTRRARTCGQKKKFLVYGVQYYRSIPAVLKLRSSRLSASWRMSDERHTKRMRGSEENYTATEKPVFFAVWAPEREYANSHMREKVQLKKDFPLGGRCQSVTLRVLRKISVRSENNRLETHPRLNMPVGFWLHASHPPALRVLFGAKTLYQWRSGSEQESSGQNTRKKECRSEWS